MSELSYKDKKKISLFKAPIISAFIIAIILSAYYANKVAQGDPGLMWAMLVFPLIIGYLCGLLVLLIVGVYYYVKRMIKLQRLVISVFLPILPVLVILMLLMSINEYPDIQ
jgi:hypothetical protein